MASRCPDRSSTEASQADNIAAAFRAFDQDQMLPHVIVDGDLTIVGRINLNSVIRGAFQSASLGYWVSQRRNGAGVATAAVAAMVTMTFSELGRHRIQGETLLHNAPFRRVLERNGFGEYGFAPSYLHIAGAWQDHALYQLINSEWSPTY